MLSTRLLNFGIVKTGKTRKLSFTIKNGAKSTLRGNVDGSALVLPLRVINGAGSFSLGRNKVRRVTVQAAPLRAGSFSGTITIKTGDSKHRTATVKAKGRARGK